MFPPTPSSILQFPWASLTVSLDPYYFEQVSQFARDWLQRRIDYARRQFRASNQYLRESVGRDLLELENQIPDMKYPWED